MPDRDPARLFFDLATTNPATFHAILDDAHWPVEDFVAAHQRSIREHCIRLGYIPNDERTVRAASNLWSYIRDLWSWMDQPTIHYSRHERQHLNLDSARPRITIPAHDTDPEDARRDPHRFVSERLSHGRPDDLPRALAALMHSI